MKAEKDPKSENLIGNGSFGNSLKALLKKRWTVKIRDPCGIVCEIAVPILLVLFGSLLLLIPVYKDSPSYLLDATAYPSPHKIFIFPTIDAETNVNSEINLDDLVANLPDRKSFTVEYSDYETYREFYL